MPTRPDRAQLASLLGAKFVPAAQIVATEGVDRLTALVTAQKAAKKANEGRVKAASGVPEGWRAPTQPQDDTGVTTAPKTAAERLREIL